MMERPVPTVEGAATRISPAVEAAWYLVQLKPGGFDRARRNLARQGYATFMPQREVTRRRASRHEGRREPLFPGYLFVRIEAERQNWRAINSTYGVARLVCLDGHRPTPVPPGLIFAIRARCDEDGMVKPPENLARGGRVRVISGPFAEALATIEDIPARDRVYVLLDIMGREVRMIVEPRQLEVATS